MRVIARHTILILPVVLVVTATGAADDSPAMRKVQTDHVDAGWVAATLPTGAPVVVQRFDTASTDFGTGANPKKKKYRILAEELRQTAPPLLAGTIVRGLGPVGA